MGERPGTRRGVIPTTRLTALSALTALTALTAAGALVALLGSAAAASAEVYRWTDDAGRLHFEQDLDQVPPGQRDAAEAAARTAPAVDRVQTFRAPPARRATTPASRSKRGGGGAAEVVRVRVQRAGNSMRVNVRLNDRVTVPFIIDTGASDVVVPKRYVEELGINLADARTGRYGTANGVIEQPLITLDSVDLKGARAEGVPAAVSSTMHFGLLGLSYFNRFHYQIDPAQGVVTLTPNALEADGLIRGGRSEADWRGEFAQMRARVRYREKQLEETPRSRSRAREQAEERLEEAERQQRKLEREAGLAHVPPGWRR